MLFNNWVFLGSTLTPNWLAWTIAKKLPPNAISNFIFPYGAISISQSLLYKNAGTFTKDTSLTFPSTILASASIIPAGASILTWVTGSTISTIPVSIAAVIAPIEPCPHMFRYPPPSMNMIPKSAVGSQGWVIIEPNISLCPLGSNIIAVLKWSRFFSKYSFFSAIVFPFMLGIPPVTILVGSPIVWESIAWMLLENFICLFPLISLLK